MKKSRLLSKSVLCASLLTLGACDGSFFKKQPEEKQLKAEEIQKLLPTRVKQRESWALDLFEISNELKIPRNAENICTIVAVVDQESNFVADPAVPGLGKKAIKEIDERLTDKLGKTMAGYFNKMLKEKPTPEDSYLQRLEKVKTERELDELYREMFTYYSQTYHVSLLTGAAKLVGQDIAENFNPITTLGSMQVHIRYAKEHKPKFQKVETLRDELYTQRGGLYYGIHRLMKYQTQYDKPLYRFADYNSGMYSSRNAAVQQVINKLAQQDLDLDGDLLLYNKDGDPRLQKSSSEEAILHYFSTIPTAPSAGQVRSDLKLEKSQEFEESQTYQFLMQRYQAKTGKEAPYAIMPKVVISGPKLSRDYNTNWFADRVNGRYNTCMRTAKRLKFVEKQP